jgi:hypothetical protein
LFVRTDLRSRSGVDGQPSERRRRFGKERKECKLWCRIERVFALEVEVIDLIYIYGDGV